jgi:hypothetical protein
VSLARARARRCRGARAAAAEGVANRFEEPIELPYVAELSAYARSWTRATLGHDPALPGGVFFPPGLRLLFNPTEEPWPGETFESP